MKQMTKAEAIRILEQSCPKRPQKLWSVKRKEAVKMAIEALKSFENDTETKSCSKDSDLISRQDAIDVAKQHWYKPDIAKELEELPSALPERKKGEWLCSDDMYETGICNSCGWDSGESWVNVKRWFKFCPHCGADMRYETNDV